MRYLALFPLLILAACAAPGDTSGLCLTRSCEEAKAAARARQIDQNEHKTCISYGLEPATPEYADCRLRLAEMRHMDAASRRAAIMQWYGMQQKQQNPKPTYSPSRQTYCYDAGGNTISCTTY